MRNKGQKSEGKGQKQRKASARPFCPHPSSVCPSHSALRAFTIVELLVVIGIIILAIGLAVPAINMLTGSRSLESAQNQISALLAMSRNDAIGAQEYRGVMFYYDPRTELIRAALVRQAETGTIPTDLIDAYLDLVPDTDTIPLPRGVGIELVDDSSNNTDDRYIGFNVINKNDGTQTYDGTKGNYYGGVILFDGHGQLVSKICALKIESGDSSVYTAMAQLLYQDQLPALPVLPAAFHDLLPSKSITKFPPTQIGFVLFELDAFKNQFGDTALPDPQIDDLNPKFSSGYSGSPEVAEETWLDNNALPVLINRYNGSLIVGE